MTASNINHRIPNLGGGQYPNEFLLYLIAFIVYYLDYSVEYYKNQWELSQSPIKNLAFVLFHLVIFMINNRILIPKFLYNQKYIIYAAIMIAMIFIGAWYEEMILEKILYADSRGTNNFRLIHFYYFIGEISAPLFAFSGIKIILDNIKSKAQIEAIAKNNLINELKFLKSQIQPHILFNSLNSLYEFTLSKSDKSPTMVLQLSNLLRYLLYDSSADTVKLSHEIETFTDYIELQRNQLEGRGVANFTVHGTINDQLEIAPFLLIPFVENAFKHSMHSQTEDITIDIDITLNKNDITLMIENNHNESYNNTNDLVYSGIGLDNVKKRLELLYPDSHKLFTENRNNRYKIELNLTL